VAVRRGVLALYFISVGVWSAHYGIPGQDQVVIAWVCGALACALLGRPWRKVLRLVRDWLPVMILLTAYDFTRGAADSLGIGVHVHVMIDFDRFLFFGTTPTEWLQAHLNDPKVVNWLDVAFTLIYTSYFIVPLPSRGSCGRATGSSSCASPGGSLPSSPPASPPTSRSRPPRRGWPPTWVCCTASPAPRRRAGS